MKAIATHILYHARMPDGGRVWVEDHPDAIGGAILCIQYSFEAKPRRYEYRGLAGADDAIALAKKYAVEVKE